MALQAGATVVMPNVTEGEYRRLYELDPGKICVNDTPIHCRTCIGLKIQSIGRTIGQGRGGHISHKNNTNQHNNDNKMMNEEMNNAQEMQRLGQLKNLVMLASADGRFADSEMAVLLAVASREQISPEDFNRVMENPDSVNIVLPEDEDTKLAYLRDMVAMMMIDGELDEQELAVCKLYAMALGYRGSIVDGMIAGVIDSLDAVEDAAE